MDSMRSLNRSLPSTPTGQPPVVPPSEQLMQAFRQAALSVTTLYKSAAHNHESIRQSGYQDCIDDLLKFLDKENLGLQDGEGWTIRQWATARYDGNLTADEAEDEETVAETQETEQPSQPQPHEQPQQQQQQQTQPPKQEPQAQNDSVAASQQPQQPAQSVFRFAAGTDASMQEPDAQEPVRLEVQARRPSGKHNRHTPRSTRNPSSTAAGSKRKLPFPDLSEIFNMNFDKKDGFDGGSSGGGGGGGSAGFGSPLKRTRLA